MTDPAGESAASQLISALVTDQLEAAAAASSGGGGGFVGAVSAGVEAVAGALQRACPAYFKEADRTFYQVDAIFCFGPWLTFRHEGNSTLIQADDSTDTFSTID